MPHDAEQRPDIQQLDAIQQFRRDAVARVERLKASHAAGDAWYEAVRAGTGMKLTVLIDDGDGFTAFDASVEAVDDTSLLFSVDISDGEDLSMGSGSSCTGWAAWMGDDIVVGWQRHEEGLQGTYEWRRRSPFGDDDAFDQPGAIARLLAAILVADGGNVDAYLPLTTQ